jgi:CDP-6-deoxy-D-xylo-4-hexulose-3-dehydrase
VFEKMTREEAAKAIGEHVREYYRTFMARKPYKDGDRISYAGRVFDEEEMASLADSALEFWLTSGRYAEQFEKKLAGYLGLPFCSLVNSGSSANLIAFMALTSPSLGERAVRRGDEVITVAAGFPTTVTPILQYGAIPVFLDVTIPQYNIDVSLLEKALSPKTKAVMIAHTMGNPFDVKAVKEFCDARKLWLVEDNCDALGAAYTINGEEKLTGTIGDIGTSSFYPAHHITMGEGGAVYTRDPLLHKLIRSFRDWGRDCMCPPGVDNFCGRRYDKRHGELSAGYDHKFVYSHFGYNVKATDMQAAIGCAQMDKLPAFVEKRRHNWKRLYEGLKDRRDKLILPEPAPHSNPSWFGFLITCKEGVGKDKLAQYIERENIQTRMLFAGNLVKQPCFDEARKTGEGYRVAGSLDATDRIMRDTFWIGVYPGMTGAMIDRMIEVVRGGLKRAETAIRHTPPPPQTATGKTGLCGGLTVERAA